LPQTILDAIEVCRRLNQRYLWVDALCIMQDSPKDVHDQVSQMHRVFSNAYFAMVVAAGDDCNAGIPFIQETPKQQYSATISGIVLASSRCKHATERDFLDSTWASRAWVSSNSPDIFRSGLVVVVFGGFGWLQTVRSSICSPSR
jgi:hypothetical protein